MTNAFFHSEHAGRVVVRWFAVAAFSAFSAGCGRPAAVSDGVAERLVIGADTVVVCDLNKIRDTIDLPLSELTAEKLRIVKLETRPEAFFKPSKTFVSENYIGVVGYEPASFKLFDGNGKFLNDIGTQGRGPNEYRNIYWAQIDEGSGRVFILPWQSDRILVFGLDGSSLPSIPLPCRSPKGIFRANPDSTVSVSVLPFENAGIESFVWNQDMQGNVVARIDAAPFRIKADFGNEMASENATRFEPVLMYSDGHRPDSLRYYDPQANRLVPVFAVRHLAERKPIYPKYAETGDYFWASFSQTMEQTGAHSFTSSAPVFFLVDKNDLTGAYFKLKLDELADIAVWPGHLQDGYFLWNVPAITLKKSLRGILDAGYDADPQAVEKIRRLDAELDDEDNNVVIYARLK